MDFRGKEIVLGVSGGIACYKALEIVRGIKEAGGQVSVVMTRAAMEFVQPLTFQTLSERPVATALFSLREESKIGHIKIVENADAMMVAPATANIIGKAAHGIADDYLSTVMLACDAPLIIAPAMNNKMWDHPAVQENIAILKRRGAHIILPDSGFLACGTIGTGRMTDPVTILNELASIITEFNRLKTISPGLLQGIKVLVTAGPTRERIDAVRYLTNYSSGKMGYALAAHCKLLGANVTLVSGPTFLNVPPGVHLIRVESSEEMYQAVIQHAADSRLIIKAAAVSDYRVDSPHQQKIKKMEKLTLELRKTKDILKVLGQKKTDSQFLVGFAAESHNLEAFAKEKLEAKNLDLIVGNNILDKDAGFDVDTNRVVLIDGSGAKTLPLLPKDKVAEKIIGAILAHDRWQKIAAAIRKYEQ
jgi:phosphopantothenoylcysteine decarboxylase/phosphopantothenate--cysteine ligase